MTEQQLELARLIVETLNLEVNPAEIDARAQLFGDSGLGLDSIDALELALAIHQAYGIEIRSDDETAVQAFASLGALSDYVSMLRPAVAAVA
ncbi:MAG: phosphopantetheine-binding protein [Alphaproteobacteria bacterium]